MPALNGDEPVRALVLERGKLTVEAGDAPVLAEQLHRQRAAVGQLLDAGDRVPAPAQHRVRVVEPHRVSHATPAQRVAFVDRLEQRAVPIEHRLALRQRLVDPVLQRPLLRPMIGRGGEGRVALDHDLAVDEHGVHRLAVFGEHQAAHERVTIEAGVSLGVEQHDVGPVAGCDPTDRGTQRVRSAGEAHSPDRLGRRPRPERAGRGVDQRGELHRLEHVLVVAARRAVSAERHAHALVEQAGERQQA